METVYIPLPQANINTYFALKAKCWLRGTARWALYWDLYYVQISGNKRPIRFPKDDYISSFQLFHCNISNTTTTTNNNN